MDGEHHDVFYALNPSRRQKDLVRVKERYKDKSVSEVVCRRHHSNLICDGCGICFAFVPIQWKCNNCKWKNCSCKDLVDLAQGEETITTTMQPSAVEPSAVEPSAPEPSARASKKRVAEEAADPTWQPQAKVERLEWKTCECGKKYRGNFKACYSCNIKAPTKQRSMADYLREAQDPVKLKADIALQQRRLAELEKEIKDHQKLARESYPMCWRLQCGVMIDKSGGSKQSWEYCSDECREMDSKPKQDQ